MIFDDVTGTYTSYTATKIVDSTASFKTDYYKGWRAVGTGFDEEITSNTSTELLFTNTISATGSYTITYANRALLTEFDSQFSSSSIITDGLLDNKIKLTKELFRKKVFNHFLLLFKGSTTDPMLEILNLGELSAAFSYYCISQVFYDLETISSGYNSDKGDIYMARYKDIIRDSINLLRHDVDKDGSLDNNELGNTSSVNYVLNR